MNAHLTYRPQNQTLPQGNLAVTASYTFSAKEKDSETSLSYFGARYYTSDLSVWLSVDPMSAKYPSLSPYTYCADNPVKLVDPNGEEIGFFWPKTGVNTFSWKAKAGVGIGYGVSHSIMGGIALDQHGMTHWTALSSKYLVNQNLYECSPNPAIEVGADVSVSVNFDRNKSYDNFIESVKSSSVSINIGGKAILGVSVGIGEDSYAVGLGLGLTIGITSDPYILTESISLSKSQAEEIGYGTSWMVVDRKYDPFTNRFQGIVQSGKAKTNIMVYCSAVGNNGKPQPDNIWSSTEYWE